MVRWLESLGLYWHAPDLRPRRLVDDEIRAELDFHLAMRARDLERDGLAPADARREAERRFGDRARVEKACRQAQIGERLMLQRIQAGLLVVLIAVVGWLAWQNQASERANATALAAMAEQLAQMKEALAAPPTPAAGAEPPTDPVEDPALVAAVRHPDDGTRVRAAPQGSPAVAAADWLARIQRTPADGHARAWSFNFSGERNAYDVGNQIADLPPDEALRVMREIWPEIRSVEHRKQILSGFAFRGLHPVVLPVLHLAATDPDVTVQSFAFEYLRAYAFQDFTTDAAAYERWHAQWDDKPIEEVVTANARAFAERVKQFRIGNGSAREFDVLWLLGRLESFEGIDVAAILREAGALETVVGWIDLPDQMLHDVAAGWLSLLRVDIPQLREWLDGDVHHRAVALKALMRVYPLSEADLLWLLESSEFELQSLGVRRLANQVVSDDFLRAHVLPRLERLDELDYGTAQYFIQSLGVSKSVLAFDALIGLLQRSPPTQQMHGALSNALGNLGDARAIPWLIGAMESVSRAEDRIQLGMSGLEPLTGVSWNRWREPGFARKWWDENKARLPAEVQAIEIPTLTWDGQ